MRGKALENGGGSLDVRITPACAGKRQALAKALSRSRDHPRMCGEKESARPARPAAWGSPPHVRGKECINGAGKLPIGITPACAGKSPWALRRPGGRRDHPRMCGEKSMKSTLRKVALGSPPRMRGKVGRTLYLVAGERITPAYAGKSFLQRTAQCRCQDHPHVCGEKTKKIP